MEALRSRRARILVAHDVRCLGENDLTEEEFLPRLHAFFQHFIDMGFATGYRVMRREALDGFGKTLPAFTYRGELIFPTWSGTCGVRIRQTTWRAGNSLHLAMNSLVKPDADFFLETRIA